MRSPLFVISFFWVIGLYIGFSFELSISLSWSLPFLGLVFFVSSFLLFKNGAKGWFVILLVSVIIFSFFRVTLFQGNHQSTFGEEAKNQIIGIRGYIDSEPAVDGNVVKFVINPIAYQVEGKEYSIPTKEKILAYIYLNKEEELEVVTNWKNGMGIGIAGTLEKPFTLNNPGQFNYQAYLANKSIYWVLKTDAISGIQLSSGKKLQVTFYQIKENISQGLDNAFQNKEHAGFMKSILLGDRQDLSKEIREDFSILGLSHLVAISGLHLSIISMMLLWIFTRMGLTKENTIIIVSLILVGYMLLTGASPSVVRATIMTILVIVGFFLKQPLTGLQGLGIALIIMTIINPVWILEIGFQLSFVITFFLLWGYQSVESKLPLQNNKIRSLVTVLIITQLSSFPLVMYYFHQYSFLSWLLNLIIVPLFSVIILPLGVITLFFVSLHLYIGDLFAFILEVLLDFLFLFTNKVASFSYFRVYGSFHSIFFIIGYYLLLIWIIVRREVKDSFIVFPIKKIFFQIEKVLILVLTISFIVPLVTPPNGTVTFIDVGQGDSILIQTPVSKNILIDSGGSITFEMAEWKKKKDPFEIGEDVILPYLKHQGINKLDAAVLTHEDFDHIGGYLTLVDHIEIDHFIVNHEFPRTEAGKILYKKLLEKRIKIISIEDVIELRIDKLTKITFIPINLKESPKENDHTLILFLTMYNTSFTFSADLEENGEQAILKQKLIKKPVDVLKVGHHGSKTSSTMPWLHSFRPRDAIISVGKDNRYNHPSDEVVNNIELIGSKVWRTDLDGAIVITVKPNLYYLQHTTYEIKGK